MPLIAAVALIAPQPGRSQEALARSLADAYDSVERCDADTRSGESITVHEGAACIYGPINRRSADVFLSLPIPEGTPIVLHSNGGDVDSALDMANRILDLRSPIIVWRSCLSSCANYLFPAGTTKIVMPASYLGWHGGPAKEVPATLSEASQVIFRRTLAKQATFFQKIGVDDQLIYMAKPGSSVTSQNRATRFWIWNMEELRNRFNVQGIIWMWALELPSSATGQG